MTEPSGTVEAVARELLAQAYEEHVGDGPYPTYAGLARRGHGAFTLCSIRAIKRALATPSDQEKRISELEEALNECARVLRRRIPRIGPEGPNTAAEQQEYEEVGGAWSMATRALHPERTPT